MLFDDDHSDLFIFAIPGGKRPTTARKTHICRLYDILQLCIQRHDLERARRAWSILVRCKEINWKLMWRTGLVLLSDSDNSTNQHDERPEYLATMMLQYPEARESIIQEMVLRLILSEQYEKALEELELYIPSPPYEDNPALHIYAGLICIYLAQPEVSGPAAQQRSQHDKKPSWDEIRLQRAQQYLERAILLDPNDIVANAWSEKLPTLTRPPERSDSPDSDDEKMAVDGEKDDKRHKRVRTESV